MRATSLAVEGRRIFFSHDRKGKSMTLNGLDISVPRGIVYGLLGPSGCGKTTLLRCIVGRLKPTKGTLRVYGRVPGETGFCIPGRGVGYMPQELALYLDITIEETLTYFGRLFHMDYSQIAERISFLTKLLEIPEKCSLIKNLSGGQKRRVSFAVALMHKPPLLILDEPTVGVDPLLRQSVWDHLVTLASTDHLTIIITTHYVEEARLAHVVGLMREGCLLAERNPEKLIEHYEVRTLEEVFLKLCRKNTKSNANLVSMEPLMSALDKVTSDYDADVWVPQEALDKQENQVITNNVSFEALDGIDIPNCNQLGAVIPDDPFNLKDIFNKPSLSERFVAGFHRTNTQMVKSFIRWRRNLPLAIFHLLSPIIQIIIFCLFIGRDPTDLDLAVVNLETTPYGFSQEFLKHIDSETIIQRHYPNLSLAIESVKTGNTWGVLYIGPYFTTAMMDRFLEGSNVENETIEKSAIKLFLDMSNQLVYSTVFTTVNKGFHDFAVSSLKSTGQNPRLADAPVIIGDPIYGKKDTSFTEFLASGMMLSVTNFMAMGLTSLTIVLERKEGMLDRAAVAGVSFCEVVFSIMFSMFLMMAVQVTFVIIIVLVIFAIPVEGSVFCLFFCALLGGLTGMATGIFVSSISDNENQASVYVLGMFTPTFMLCGILWPVEAMGRYLRYFSYSLPLTLLADSMRSILVRGWSLIENNAWNGPLVSAIWTLSLISLSVVVFKFRN